MRKITDLRKDLHKVIVRKMKAAGFQVSDVRIVKEVKRKFLWDSFRVETSRALTEERLYDALAAAHSMKLAKPDNPAHRPMSDSQRRAIVRLGRFVIGKVYGDDFLFRNLPDWTKAASGRKTKWLAHLTAQEAHHVIKTLEKIEARLIEEGKLKTNRDGRSYVANNRRNGGSNCPRCGNVPERNTARSGR